MARERDNCILWNFAWRAVAMVIHGRWGGLELAGPALRQWPKVMRLDAFSGSAVKCPVRLKV